MVMQPTEAVVQTRFELHAASPGMPISQSGLPDQFSARRAKLLNWLPSNTSPVPHPSCTHLWMSSDLTRSRRLLCLPRPPPNQSWMRLSSPLDGCVSLHPYAFAQGQTVANGSYSVVRQVGSHRKGIQPDPSRLYFASVLIGSGITEDETQPQQMLHHNRCVGHCSFLGLGQINQSSKLFITLIPWMASMHFENLQGVKERPNGNTENLKKMLT
ncbi:UNVERIFIED_CONTAM: hypothetical protein FKN15_038378 [Acipenser sinensis]